MEFSEILKSSRGLPDIAEEINPGVQGTLDQVGMEGIEMPILWANPAGQRYLLPARVDAFVSLDDPKARGIHMSRLYLTLAEDLQKEAVSFSGLEKTLSDFISSQRGLSRSAFLKIAFQLPVQREALVTDAKGWRLYPCEYRAEMKEGVLTFTQGFKIQYSSTCPCSAALAEKVILDQLETDFPNETLKKSDLVQWFKNTKCATPHAQRSEAQVSVMSPKGFDPLFLIDGLESALGTPVQAAVKRQDEREFARLNAQNMMFCEDAGRRLKGFLDSLPEASDYHIRVEHFESLHPHNAVSIVSKN